MVLLLAALLLLSSVPALSAQEGSFAFVNKSKVNIREAPGGKIMTRVEDGITVYVLGSLKKGGKTWYRVVFQEGEYTKYTKAGWMDGTFLTGLRDQYHDVTQIALGDSHLLMLHRDGTASAAGVWMREEGDVIGWRDVESIAAARFGSIGLRADGTVAVSKRGEDVDLASWTNVRAVFAQNDIDQVIGVGKDGAVLSFYPIEGWLMPGWAGAKQMIWADFWNVQLLMDGTVHIQLRGERTEESVWQRLLAAEKLEGVKQIALCTTYGFGAPAALACLLADGTVRIFDTGSASSIDISAAATWTDMDAIAANQGYILGLKKDGSVVMAGEIVSPGIIPGATYLDDDLFVNFAQTGQLNAWQGMKAIAAGRDMIAGLHADGTVDMLAAWRWEK